MKMTNQVVRVNHLTLVSNLEDSDWNPTDELRLIDGKIHQRFMNNITWEHKWIDCHYSPYVITNTSESF